METAPPPSVGYGFIGLGSMGYSMCTNLRSKIPSSSKLYICDVVPSVLERFTKDWQGSGEVIIVKTPKEVADHAVSVLCQSEETGPRH